MAQSTVGIDIGEYGLKMVLVSGDEVKKTASAPMTDGLMRDGEITSMEAMSELIAETAKKNGIARGRCAVILPDTLAFAKNVTMPVMTEEQLRYNLPFEFRDYVSDEKSKYFYDYAVQEMVPGDDGEIKEMRLYACAAQRSAIADYKNMLHRAGFRLACAAPEACAYCAIIADYEKRNQIPAGDKTEHCFIDLGHGNTRMFILEGHNYVTHRSFDIGAADVEAAVADMMNVEAHMAANYVQSNYHSVLSDPRCVEIYGRVAVEIMKAINFYNFNDRDNALDKAYVCGGGAVVRPLVQTIADTLSLDLRSINELMPAMAGDDTEQPSLFAKAVGIAMQS